MLFLCASFPFVLPVPSLKTNIGTVSEGTDALSNHLSELFLLRAISNIAFFI
jgi:hypothetical protein